MQHVIFLSIVIYDNAIIKIQGRDVQALHDNCSLNSGGTGW